MLGRLGLPIAFAIVLAVAALLVWRFEWWPAVPIAGLSTIVIIATRWPLDQGRVRRGAAGIAIALLLVAGGVFLFFLAQWGGAACEPCTDNSIWLWPGILAVLSGFGLLAWSIRSITRSTFPPSESSHPVSSR